MGDLKIGDIVARISYGSDILFKVVDIVKVGNNKIAILNGLCYRLEADAPESDLIVQEDSHVREYSARIASAVDMKLRSVSESNMRSTHMGLPKKKFYRHDRERNTKKFSRPGKVLHVDSDRDYLATCLEQYSKFGIEAVGAYVKEKDQPLRIFDLLKKHKPDILVLTGHDGFVKDKKSILNPDNYRNSKYYIEAVKEARRYEGNLDSLIIFAGACQSMYNQIIEAGANYASSPYRVLIHALDPVFICQKVAFTGINSVLAPQLVIEKTITGYKGIGGVETRGKYRDGYPMEPYGDKN
jgi:spore coat assembly protein